MNRIRELRKQKRLTQNELANLLNIEQSSVSKWENGRTIPDILTLNALSEVFNVSVDYLLGKRALNNNEESKQTENKKTENKYSFTIIGHGGKKGIIQLTPEQIKDLDGFFDEDN